MITRNYSILIKLLFHIGSLRSQNTFKQQFIKARLWQKTSLHEPCACFVFIQYITS